MTKPSFNFYNQKQISDASSKPAACASPRLGRARKNKSSLILNPNVISDTGKIDIGPEKRIANVLTIIALVFTIASGTQCELHMPFKQWLHYF